MSTLILKSFFFLGVNSQDKTQRLFDDGQSVWFSVYAVQENVKMLKFTTKVKLS